LFFLAFHHPPPKPDSVVLESGFFIAFLSPYAKRANAKDSTSVNMGNMGA
jgi:hypothetical protein